jgi:hypothetical protein
MRLINRSPQAEFGRVSAVKRTKQELNRPGCDYRLARKGLTKRNSFYITQLFYNR